MRALLVATTACGYILIASLGLCILIIGVQQESWQEMLCGACALGFVAVIDWWGRTIINTK